MKRAFFTSLALSVLFYMVVFPVNAAENIKPTAQIVFVADISGSMEQADKDQYIKDALKLGVDLVPYDAEIALVMVSDKIVSETEVINTGDEIGRIQLKKSIEQITYSGNTDFGVGLYKALKILESAGEEIDNKRIVFLGDFVEGGNTTLNSTGTSNEAITALDAFAGNAIS